MPTVASSSALLCLRFPIHPMGSQRLPQPAVGLYREPRIWQSPGLASGTSALILIIYLLFTGSTGLTFPGSKC